MKCSKYLSVMFSMKQFYILSNIFCFFNHIYFQRCDKNPQFNFYKNNRGVRKPENIGNSMVGTSRVPEKVEIPENFENLTIVSRTTLQCCIAAYKIYKYTVQFLLPVKLLETRILRIV